MRLPEEIKTKWQDIISAFLYILLKSNHISAFIRKHELKALKLNKNMNALNILFYNNNEAL